MNEKSDMPTLKAMLESTRRVRALADVCHRYAAIVANATSVLKEIAVAFPETHERIEAAVKDVDVQLASIHDALSAALSELPEGRS